MTENDKKNIAVDAPDEEAVKSYNAIVKEAELIDIRLVGFNFKMQPQYYEYTDGGKKGKSKKSFGVEISPVNYDPDTTSLGSEFEWRLEVTGGKRKLLTITANYFVVYGNVPAVGAEHHKTFMQRVGRFATFPYFRSLVSQMSWESKAELPILPVLK
ncbi:hypothetical protein JQC79_19205 [Ochrobactrum anthropi]|uniref:hypothetical protein n=1 Tax=Brucella anthropi TaxID=529 RepID=UPI00194F77C2|nr:hypothetical protein [Brucella anthropi]MBM6397883.1 hypothetical protein [Brucella anthropi]